MSEIIPINPHRHLLANQIRLFGMTNHPPTGYPSSLRLLNTFKTAYPLHRFVTHEFPVHEVGKAMAQAFRYRRLRDRRFERAVSTPKRTLAEGVGCAAGGHSRIGTGKRAGV
jgi:hypothetical protein